MRDVSYVAVLVLARLWLEHNPNKTTTVQEAGLFQKSWYLDFHLSRVFYATFNGQWGKGAGIEEASH